MKRSFIALGRDRNNMNKTEAAHAAELEMRKRVGEVLDYLWQPMRLKLAPNCCYEPDFLLFLADHSIEFHEVKGSFITDDAIVKVKVAAERFPWFRFVIYQYDRRGCKTKELPVL
jgi:hypothetical protein